MSWKKAKKETEMGMAGVDMKTIEPEAADYESCLRAHRRALHRIPEAGYQEYKTHEYLMEHLAKTCPDDLRTFAQTGIRAVFRGNGQGRVVAFRSDMDALPVTEETGCSFASGHAGFIARLRA